MYSPGNKYQTHFIQKKPFGSCWNGECGHGGCDLGTISRKLYLNVKGVRWLQVLLRQPVANANVLVKAKIATGTLLDNAHVNESINAVWHKSGMIIPTESSLSTLRIAKMRWSGQRKSTRLICVQMATFNIGVLQYVKENICQWVWHTESLS